jgi:hypothetical protein
VSAAGFVLLAAFSLQGCKKGDAVAATVNGESISMDQYHRYLELKPQVQVIVNPRALQAASNGDVPQQPYVGRVIGTVGLQAMTDLVQQAILRQLAKDEKSWPTSEEIESELKDRTKANPGFVRELANNGFTMEMIRNDLAIGLAQVKLTTQGIVVTDAEVDKYITDHPKEFEIPQMADMTWMLVPDEKTKAAADADLKSGKDFLTVAQQYSIAPDARRKNYRFDVQSVPQLASFGPALKSSVDKLIKNGGGEQQQTDWLKFTEGFAKFYINKVSAGRKMPIDDTLKKNLRRQMAVQKGAQGKDINLRIQDRMKKADIKILIPYLEESWKRSMESLKTNQAPGSTTGQK